MKRTSAAESEGPLEACLGQILPPYHGGFETFESGSQWRYSIWPVSDSKPLKADLKKKMAL